MEGALVLTPALPPNPPPLDSSPPSNGQEVSSHLAAPPPPPLPPPPAPPPPPLPFASWDTQRRSMKKVNWDAIPRQSVLGKLNVWTSQRPQEDLVLDIRSMEELFSHVDTRASQRRTKVVGRKRFEGMAHFAPEPQVSILDSKRSMNVGIFLKQFKRPVREMVDDISQGNWLRFGAGKLRELCKLLPEDSEVRQLCSFSGDVSLLPEADQFMVRLVKLTGYEERLKTMVLREEFFPLMEEMKNSVTVMIKGANELLDCDDLHSVIRLVLKAGNYMNAGGYSGNAIGFRMTSLLKLADTKANKPGMNLLHFVAKQAEGIDTELLTFSSQLEHIGRATRVSKEELKADFEREVKKFKEVNMYASRQPVLLQQMEAFIMRAEAKLADMESLLQELNSLSQAVAEYFCEDPAAFNLEECFSIFHSFCKKFDKAVQENRDREVAELRRKHRESIRNPASRRSTWSSLEPQPDPETSGLESVLHSFLSAVPVGLTRSRRNLLSQIEGSPELSPQAKPPLEEPDASPESREWRSPDKKHSKLQVEENQEPTANNKEQVEKMREENRDREVAELRRKHRESIRNPASRRCTWSSLEPQSDPETSSLESDLHSFLSAVPVGLTRSRRSLLSQIEGSPELSPQAKPPLEDPDASPESRERRSPDKKHSKLQVEENQEPTANNKEEVEKMREVTRKVLRYQNSQGKLGGDNASVTPRRPGRAEATPATPGTPRPSTRDFVFFGTNGKMGSPWTILSPFTCPHGNTPSRNRHRRHLKQSFSMSNGDDLDDGVWQLNPNPSHSNPTSPTRSFPGTVLQENDEGGGGDTLPRSMYPESLTVTGNASRGSSSLPECSVQRAPSQGPILRSLSLDETGKLPASGFSLGELFQKGVSQRTRSCSGSRSDPMTGEGAGVCSGVGAKAGKHLERQGNSSGLISFFRRIGNRSKPVDVEEQNFRGSDT